MIRRQHSETEVQELYGKTCDELRAVIEDSQFTTSVRDTINLFFLLGNINLPDEVKIGTPIYRG